jgi:hypothetical protein
VSSLRDLAVVAWLYDEAAHAQASREGRNFWAVYWEEILGRLGVRAQTLPRGQLGPEGLAGLAVLVVPAQLASPLSGEELAVLARWAESGGMVVAVAAPGSERLGGLEWQATVAQPTDDYSVAAVLTYAGPARAGLSLDSACEPQSPVLSPVQVVRATAGPPPQVWAELHRPADRHPLGPGLALRRLGAGWVAYWGFDLAQTLWAMQQGRPVYLDRDGDGYFRTCDAIVIRDFDLQLPHADLMSFLLRELLGVAGVPLLDPLPPAEGEPADCLLYWGGDEEGAAGTAAWASQWMSKRGLPYHVNVMPDPQGRFACSQAEAADIRARGHEVSLHLNFVDGYQHPWALDEARVAQQVQWFRQTFGFVPNTVVFHWVLWYGSSEPCQWLAACGVRGDNSRLHRPYPPLNPVNRLGYGFGTAFPYRPWTDWHDGHRRLRFVWQPITAYECGYERETNRTDYSQLHLALEQARRWGLTQNLFFHSLNITWYPSCRAAIEEVRRWLADHQVRPVHMGNDRLTDWWLAREEVDWSARAEGGRLVLSVDCPWPEGCTVRLPHPWQAEALSSAARRAGRWLRVALPPGRSTLRAVACGGPA